MTCWETFPGNQQGHREWAWKGKEAPPGCLIQQSPTDAGLGLVSPVNSGKSAGHTLALSPSWVTELEHPIPWSVGQCMCQAPFKHIKLVACMLSHLIHWDTQNIWNRAINFGLLLFHHHYHPFPYSSHFSGIKVKLHLSFISRTLFSFLCIILQMQTITSLSSPLRVFLLSLLLWEPVWSPSWGLEVTGEGLVMKVSVVRGVIEIPPDVAPWASPVHD